MNNSIFKIVLMFMMIVVLIVNVSFCFNVTNESYEDYEENNQTIATNETITESSSIRTDTISTAHVTTNSISNRFSGLDENEMDKIIMEYNLKRNQNKSKLINQIFEKQFEMSENQKTSNERFDKLLKIIENQNQFQLNNSKILAFLNKKIKFDLKLISSNILIDELLNDGFKFVYDQLYSHGTTNQELFNINLKCNKESIMCVGGSDGLNTLLLVSCGSCLEILTTTELDKPRLVNGVWWYFTPDKSFGFAPSSSIRQYWYDCYGCHDCADDHNICQDSNRLSWKLSYAFGGGNGGFRLGLI